MFLGGALLSSRNVIIRCPVFAIRYPFGFENYARNDSERRKYRGRQRTWGSENDIHSISAASDYRKERRESDSNPHRLETLPFLTTWRGGFPKREINRRAGKYYYLVGRAHIYIDKPESRTARRPWALWCESSLPATPRFSQRHWGVNILFTICILANNLKVISVSLHL